MFYETSKRLPKIPNGVYALGLVPKLRRLGLTRQGPDGAGPLASVSMISWPVGPLAKGRRDVVISDGGFVGNKEISKKTLEKGKMLFTEPRVSGIM